MNLYFCGMIGSGKTTLGNRLADLVGLPFRDLDHEMDGRLGYSFHRLVREQGWLAFRELEYAICRDFSRTDHSIICLGGGTVRVFRAEGKGGPEREAAELTVLLRTDPRFAGILPADA